MRKVLFLCSAGMSTSLIVTKTQQAADARGIELEITAMGEAAAKDHVKGAAVVLLGPQVRYLLNSVKKHAEGSPTKVGVIDSVSYGRLDGEAILKQIEAMLEG